MFARLGSDFHESAPAKISESDQEETFPIGSHVSPNFSTK